MRKKIFVRLLFFAGVLLLLLGIAAICYWRWSPGSRAPLPIYPDNAIWLERDWLEDCCTQEKITGLLNKLRENHISVVFPELGTVQKNGQIMFCNDEQLERFLDCSERFNIKVIPYVLGILNTPDCVENEEWRREYVVSVVKFLSNHPRLAGVQINFEPWLYDKNGYLYLLDELRPAIENKILSVAVYSPRTKQQPYSPPYWAIGYYFFIAERCDLMAVMLFNTSIVLEKYYTEKMTGWTNAFADMGNFLDCRMILGISAKDKFRNRESSSRVENLSSALQGISASPDNMRFGGVAIYGEKDMDEAKWREWRNFIR